MSEKLNLKIGVIGANSNKIRPRAITLNESIDLIKKKNYPKDIEDGLIEILKKRPSNTYENFFKNIYMYLKRLEDK